MSQTGRPEHDSNSSIEKGAAVLTPPFTLDIGPSLVAIRVRVAVFSTAFHKDMSLWVKKVSVRQLLHKIADTYLESILAREALVTVRAGERLHG